MKSLIYVLAALCALPLSSIADEGWTVVSGNSDVEFSGKHGSFERVKNKSNDDVFVIVGREVNKKTRNIVVEKWYVRASDCRRQQGKIVTLNINGDFKYDNDFVFGAGNIASGMAEFICSIEGAIKASNDRKGL